MPAAEFVFCDEQDVVKKFPVNGLTPSILARTFKIVESTMKLLSDEEVFSDVEAGIFDPPLSETAKKFTIYGDKAPETLNIVPRNNVEAVSTLTARPIINMAETKIEIGNIIKKTSDIRHSVQLLSSAPQTVLLLDSVQVLMSRTEDIQLEVNTVKFDCIENPTTFKAAFFRCSNEIRDTFFNCGLAMTKIQNLTSSLPDDFIRIMSVFANLDKPEFQLILMLSCQNIKGASAKLVEVSEDISAQTEHAQRHMDQLIQVAIATEHDSKTRDKEKTSLKRSYEQKKEGFMKITSTTEKEYVDQLKHRDRVYEDFSKQLKITSPPSTTAKVVQATGSVLSDLSEVMSALMNNIAKAMSRKNSKIQQKQEMFRSLITLLATIRNEGFENAKTLDEKIAQYRTLLKAYLRYKSNTKAGAEAHDLAGKRIEFFDELTGCMKPSELIEQDLFKMKLEEMKTTMDVTLKIINEVKNIEKNKEDVEKIQKEKEQKQRIENAKMRTLELAKLNYEKENERAEEMRKKIKEQNENIMNIAAQMATIDMENVELTKVIHYLKDAKDALMYIHTSWTGILQFFKTVNHTINEDFNNQLTSMLKHTDMYNDTGNKELLPIMVKLMMGACGQCVQFGHCAQIYAEISTKHVMPVMNVVTRSMALESVEAKQRQKNLRSKIEKVTSEVDYLIRKRVEDNETKQVPRILENFAETCYGSLSNSFEIKKEKQPTLLGAVVSALNWGQ